MLRFIVQVSVGANLPTYSTVCIPWSSMLFVHFLNLEIRLRLGLTVHLKLVEDELLGWTPDGTSVRVVRV